MECSPRTTDLALIQKPIGGTVPFANDLGGRRFATFQWVRGLSQAAQNRPKSYIFLKHIFLRPKRSKLRGKHLGHLGQLGQRSMIPGVYYSVPGSFRGKDLGHVGQRSGKIDTPGFSHESNVFKITGLGRRGLSTPWRVQRRRTQRNIAFAMKTGVTRVLTACLESRSGVPLAGGTAFRTPGSR